MVSCQYCGGANGYGVAYCVYCRQPLLQMPPVNNPYNAPANAYTQPQQAYQAANIGWYAPIELQNQNMHQVAIQEQSIGVSPVVQQAPQGWASAAALQPVVENELKQPESVKDFLFLLWVGLLPFLGIVLCLLWGYGNKVASVKRNLAKAMLWFHALGMVILLLGLGYWVYSLVG